MVSPIDYTMNVLNPIEGYLQGLKFGEGILSARQDRAASEQAMRIQQATFEEQQRARQEARAQAARAQAQAEAGRQALFDYFDKQEARTATPNDLRRAILQFPGMADQFQAVANSFSEERLGNEQRFGKQLSFALARGQTDAARNLLQERLDAATAAGDEQTAAAYQAQIQELDASPEGLLMQTLMPLAATMDPDDFDKFYETALGMSAKDFKVKSSELVGNIASIQTMEDGTTRVVDTRTNTVVTGPAAASLIKEAEEVSEEPLSPMGKLVFDLNAGNITPEQFKSASEKGPLVQNIVGEGETEFAKTAGKTQATQYANLTEAGFSASRNLRELDTLENVLKNIDTGGGAAVKAYLGQYGIATEGLDLIQAAEAAINRLVPAQRPPGSGTMSDADLALFKRSLPSLINQPGGNQTIIDTIRAINEYDVAVSVISGRALDGELKPADARAAIRDLPNPLADFKAQAGAPTQAQDAGAVLTKEQFMQSPDLAGLDDAMKESVWKKYKEIKGIK